jgi:hypothetical protein
MRVNERATTIMPIIDKIGFTLRNQASVDMQMVAKFDKGKAEDGYFETYRRAVSDLKSSYKTEKGFLKLSILTGQILDYSA